MTEELKKIIKNKAIDWCNSVPIFMPKDINHEAGMQAQAYSAGIEEAINNPEKYGLPHWVKASNDNLPEREVPIKIEKAGGLFSFCSGSKSIVKQFLLWSVKDKVSIYWLCEQPTETS